MLVKTKTSEKIIPVFGIAALATGVVMGIHADARFRRLAEPPKTTMAVRLNRSIINEGMGGAAIASAGLILLLEKLEKEAIKKFLRKKQ
jgi:hypothetical protein